MGILKSLSVDEIVKRGSVKDADVLRLRSAFYEDGAIDAEEADKLFAINDGCPVKDPSWSQFFVEAITDHVVLQAEPEGYITTENAKWLIDRISNDGKVDTKAELELLISVIDRARWSPASLVHFCLEQVKHAVLTGAGPLRGAQALEKGTIGEQEIELLRRILYAFGGDGNVSVTRAEAEVLFDINDAVAAGDANPAWTDFFVKAVANVVMATSGYAVPSREEALARETWLEQRNELSPASFLAAMVKTSLDAVIGSYGEQSSEERALARLERQRVEIITNEEITGGEAQWLAERIGRDGHLTKSEEALLAYLKDRSPSIHPTLNDFVQRLGVAA